MLDSQQSINFLFYQRLPKPISQVEPVSNGPMVPNAYTTTVTSVHST